MQIQIALDTEHKWTKDSTMFDAFGPGMFIKNEKLFDKYFYGLVDGVIKMQRQEKETEMTREQAAYIVINNLCGFSAYFSEKVAKKMSSRRDKLTIGGKLDANF